MGMDPLTLPAILSSSSVAGLGISTASALGQQQAVQQQAALQKSRDALQLAEQERSREEELEKTLSRQNAWFAASGTDATSGSALSVANAAVSDAQNDLSLIASGAALTDQARSLNGALSSSSLARSLLSTGLGAANKLTQLKWG